MKYISLFAGIGCADVAWMPLGWEPLAFSEIDPFASAVLATRFPNVPNIGDITQHDWKQYRGRCDLVIGGSPCQAYSVAGLRQSLDDPRGQLTLAFVRACNDIDPPWVVWENVPYGKVYIRHVFPK
ncbi:MAG: DNA cytosine methyltransferase [Planctomycetes bacterium]|nr:DNA cytosine methyltransferase [Planctomycetota bacterium]